MSLDREGKDTEQGGPQLRGNIPSFIPRPTEPPDTVSQRRIKMTFGTLRPQILVAIICATVFSIFALWMGYKMEATEIVTAVIGGIFGFLGGVSLKVLENE